MVVSAQEILQRLPEHERARAQATTTPQPVKPEIDQLLERGDASSILATRRLAGRVRTMISELRERLKTEVEQEQVVTQIAVLRKQLDDAEAKLRRMRGIKPVRSRTATPRTAVDTRKVRAWAVANGHQVKPQGILPAAVLTAYRAAHGGDR